MKLLTRWGMAALVCAAGGVAVAQTPGQTERQTPGQTGRQTERQTPASPQARGQQGQQGQFATLRASQVIGANVKNTQDEDLGEIQDLAIDVDNNAVAYAVLSSGGILGMGEDWFAIPWQSLQHQPDGTVRVNIDKSKLESAQGFDKNKWPDMANQQWATETHTQFGARPYWSGQPGDKPGKIVKASKLIGQDVHNAQKEDLGEVEDLLIDTHRGRVAMAVLDLGALGMQDQLFGVPLKKLTVNQEDQPVVINVDKEQLKSAPHFARADWPDRDRQHVEKVYTFYDVEPYWGTVVPVEHRETMPNRDREKKDTDTP